MRISPISNNQVQNKQQSNVNFTAVKANAETVEMFNRVYKGFKQLIPMEEVVNNTSGKYLFGLDVKNEPRFKELAKMMKGHYMTTDEANFDGYYEFFSKCVENNITPNGPSYLIGLIKKAKQLDMKQILPDEEKIKALRASLNESLKKLNLE